MEMKMDEESGVLRDFCVVENPSQPNSNIIFIYRKYKEIQIIKYLFIYI